MAGENNDGDEEFRQAFGEHTEVRVRLREEINRIKNNDPEMKIFFGSGSSAVRNLSDRAWELLGHYVARNAHLKEINLVGTGLTDEKLSILFKHLTGSSSLKILSLSNNHFGMNGIQSMVPFLKNSSLTGLGISGNANDDGEASINTECFRLLIDGLRDGPIEKLAASNCNIEDIMALEDCSLPHLKKLGLANNNIQNIFSLEKYTNLKFLLLDQNNIGGEGCKSMAKLLQNQSSKLMYLNFASNDIGDEEAKILANSLKHNTTLKRLHLRGNAMREVGHRAFLKLLNDVSSIQNTYKSNHTLKNLELPTSSDSKLAAVKKRIDQAITTNKRFEGNHEGAGRAKVTATQLNSIERMELCRLQGIDYSFNNLFANIKTVFLPNILQLAAKNHGQNELYRMLVVTAPDLVSLIDKTAMLKATIAKTAARISKLNIEHATLSTLMSDLYKRLDPVGSGGKKQPIVEDRESSNSMSIRKKKRPRSASF